MIPDHAVDLTQYRLVDLCVIQQHLEDLEFLHFFPFGKVQDVGRYLVAPADGSDLLAECLFECWTEITMFIKFLFWNPSVENCGGGQFDHIPLLLP